MAMIKFFECFNDVLICLADGKDYRLNEICEFVAKQKNLSTEDRIMRLEKSGQTVLSNRVGWARTYLKMAGLVEYPHRAFARITAEGRKVLTENQTVDLNFLKKYKSFNDFQSRSKDGGEVESPTDEPKSETPEEQIKTAFLQINATLADEILDEIIKLSPVLFEKLALKLLEKMGYGGTLDGSGIVTKTIRRRRN